MTRFRLVGTTRLRMNSLYFLHADRADRNFGVPVHVVEQADAQVTGKALVNQFQRRHPATDDPFLGAEVVGIEPEPPSPAIGRVRRVSPVTPFE